MTRNYYMKKLQFLIILLVAASCILQASVSKAIEEKTRFKPIEPAITQLSHNKIIKPIAIDFVLSRAIAYNEIAIILDSSKLDEYGKRYEKAHENRIKDFFHTNNKPVNNGLNLPDIIDNNDSNHIHYGNAYRYKNMRNLGKTEDISTRVSNALRTSENTNPNQNQLSISLPQNANSLALLQNNKIKRASSRLCEPNKKQRA